MIPHDKKQPVRAYQVMDMVLTRGDAVELAPVLSVSTQLINSWCRPPYTENPNDTGKYGPLDRLRTIIVHIKEDDGSPERAYPIGQYVAHLLGGVFVPLVTGQVKADSEIMARVSKVLKEVGGAVEEVRLAWFEVTPGRISPKEYATCVDKILEAIVALDQLKKWIESHATRS